MRKTGSREVKKLKNDCYTLEEQIKVLVRTEIQLRRTKAELTQSKKKIEDYNKTLEQKVEERTRELLASNEKLRQEMAEREKAENELKKIEESLKRAEKMEAIGLLAGSVAHDLNNQLTSIIGFPNLLLRKLPPDDPMCIPLNAIKNCGERAAAVVRDLATLSKKGIINTVSFNMNDILHTVINSPEFVRLKKDAPDVEFDNRTFSSTFNICGSAIDIYNGIIHLLANAFESMKNSGVLTISTENICFDKPENRYELIDAGEYVTITISDTGTGIPKKHLDRIFEPFYSRKVMGKSGTGLGMAIVWGMVKEHKGFIDIESAEDTGTTTTLYFPISRSTIIQSKAECNLENYRGSNETVLIIDDVDNQREICMEMAAELGYRPASVRSGEEAIEYLKNSDVDLLILDMIMEPGMDGLETYRNIVQCHPGQKAIIASGFCESDLISQAQALGAGIFVRKPYTFETLGIAIWKELHPE